MTMKALRCTQCGAELELDNSKDFGFCCYCGTKIMLTEKKEIIHSGEVQMVVNNTQKGLNRLDLANTAFESQNYEEAYTYYTKALEDLPNNLTALYRKGICAVFNSPLGDLRIAELRAMLTKAVALMESEYDNIMEQGEENNPAADNLLDTIDEMETDLCTMVDRYKNIQTDYIQTHDLATAQQQSRNWAEMVELYSAAYQGLTTYSVRENYLQAASIFCKKVLSLNTKYYSHTTTNKKGKRKDHYEHYNIPKSQLDIIRKGHTKFVRMYSELPSVVERNEKLASSMAEADAAAQSLHMEMTNAKGILDNAKAAFYNDHPELKARFQKSQYMAWLALAPSVVFFLITLLSWRFGVGAQIIAGVSILGSLKLKKKFAAKAAVQLEEEIFPDELKALETKYYDAVDAWKENENNRMEIQAATEKANAICAA